jgi:hypothetical protein
VNPCLRCIDAQKARASADGIDGTPGCGYINNNPCSRLKHPGVPDGSDASDGTSYPLMENYTLSVGQATCCIAYSPPLLGAWYRHHQNDTCVTLFAGAAVML